MNLEKQVTSIEISKRLKELGVKQESYFHWHLNLTSHAYLVHGLGADSTNISAFTVAELGEMLPQIIKIGKIKYQIFQSAGMDKQWFIVYANENDYEDNAPFPFMLCHSEADARGKMLIYLLENKLIIL